MYWSYRVNRTAYVCFWRRQNCNFAVQLCSFLIEPISRGYQLLTATAALTVKPPLCCAQSCPESRAPTYSTYAEHAEISIQQRINAAWGLIAMGLPWKLVLDISLHHDKWLLLWRTLTEDLPNEKRCLGLSLWVTFPVLHLVPWRSLLIIDDSCQPAKKPLKVSLLSLEMKEHEQMFTASSRMHGMEQSSNQACQVVSLTVKDACA